ncbi:MAG: hypothetical protein J7K75_08855 [Desulfuromonas sp.]|nr:hypothetical protein [Desulfuromonas sp.]
MRTLSISLLLTLLTLTACQTKEDTTAPTQTETSQQPAPQVVIPDIKLEVSEQVLTELSQKDQSELSSAAPQRLTGEAKNTKDVEISAGVLTDKNAESIEESISGGEVKIKIKLD